MFGLLVPSPLGPTSSSMILLSMMLIKPNSIELSIVSYMVLNGVQEKDLFVISP